jgi:putative SOS response-associated peptidase YedK
MCGRFERVTPIKVLATLFDCPAAPAETPTHYNVAPTQPVAVVRVIRAAPDTGQREMTVMRWGLIPSWADDPAIGNRLINARSETAADKPSFRAAFKQRRCLVPVDGFYEWKATPRIKTKQPYLIRLKDGKPFALAGLWEAWTAPDGELVESFTILTTDANEMMRPIHDRMPVILAPEDYDRWLDKATTPEEVQALLRQYPAEGMESFPVSTLVNNPRNESPKCLEPAMPAM